MPAGSISTSTTHAAIVQADYSASVFARYICKKR